MADQIVPYEARYPLMCRFSGQAIAMSMTEYTAAPHVTDETRWGLESFFDKRPVLWSVKPA